MDILTPSVLVLVSRRLSFTHFPHGDTHHYQLGPLPDLPPDQPPSLVRPYSKSAPELGQIAVRAAGFTDLVRRLRNSVKWLWLREDSIHRS